jgi:hypothetical protein
MLLLYWYGSGASHLRAEEDILLTAWGRHGGADHPLSAAIRADHARLAGHVAAVAEDPRAAADELRRIGIALAALIRRVERELARVVARSLAPEERIEVDRALARFEGAAIRA